MIPLYYYWILVLIVSINRVVLWTLNKGGPKPAIMIAGSLIFVGNWIRYAGTRAGGGYYGVVMFGQIIIGLAQPFVLTAPTRYSDLWFTAKGRISATAIASLANPFGGAVSQSNSEEVDCEEADICITSARPIDRPLLGHRSK